MTLVSIKNFSFLTKNQEGGSLVRHKYFYTATTPLQPNTIPITASRSQVKNLDFHRCQHVMRYPNISSCSEVVSEKHCLFCLFYSACCIKVQFGGMPYVHSSRGFKLFYSYNSYCRCSCCAFACVEAK